MKGQQCYHQFRAQLSELTFRLLRLLQPQQLVTISFKLDLAGYKEMQGIYNKTGTAIRNISARLSSRRFPQIQLSCKTKMPLCDIDFFLE